MADDLFNNYQSIFYGYAVKFIPFIKSLIILFCFSHIAYLSYGLVSGSLGTNPIEVFTHATGAWGLYFLLATLTVTPLRKIFHWNAFIRFRRLLGLCSFSYVFMHLLVFFLFDHFFDWAGIVEDILKRPYITVGFASFLIFLALAVTSISALQRRMGKHWLTLHKGIYVAAVLVIIHYWWLTKADILWPLTYTVMLSALFVIRLYYLYVAQARSKTR